MSSRLSITDMSLLNVICISDIKRMSVIPMQLWRILTFGASGSNE
uniref:Uncharacterized protein n=1 Tax=Arundo donax TaxID=35708 RepID=A0A0A8ZGN8_ARUDO